MKKTFKIFACTLTVLALLIIPVACSMQQASTGSSANNAQTITAEPQIAAAAVAIEAESMSKSGYSNESNSSASGGVVIRLSSTTGSVTKNFSGTTASYNISVKYIDQANGASTFTLSIGSTVIGTWTGDQATTADLFLTKTFSNISVANGAQIKLTGTKNGSELAKFDVIAFSPVGIVSSSSTTTSSSSSSSITTSSSSSVSTSSSSSSATTSSSSSFTSTSTGIIGFAQNVTGGAGGQTVYASDYDTFNSYTDSNNPYIIYVTGSFPLSGMSCHVRSNKTIIGQSGVVLSGGGLYLYNSSNVIIQNLTICGSTEDNIGIHYSNNIWIDHCTLYDSQDGNIDITQSSDNITISWCKFFYTADNGHDLCNLIASSDSDNGSQYHVTFHHNWWGTLVTERMPSVRFGRVHVFNNYYNAPGNNYCARTRISAELLVENNFFENVKNPWEQFVTGSGTQGKLKATGNNVGFMDTSNGVTWYVNPTADDGTQSFLIPGTDTVFTPTYSYSLESAANAKASVIAGAGAH